MNSRAGSRAAISSSRSGRVRLRGWTTCGITRRPSTLGPGPEASLDVFDPGVELGDVLSERREVALENIAPNPLVSEQGLDAPKRLGDRVVLLLEAFEAPIDLVEVAEELCAKFVESAVDGVEAPIHGLEALTDDLEALVDGVEAPVDGLETPIDGLETLAEEQDELLVLRRRHASISTLPGPKLQVCRVVDSRTGPLRKPAARVSVLDSSARAALPCAPWPGSTRSSWSRPIGSRHISTTRRCACWNARRSSTLCLRAAIAPSRGVPRGRPGTSRAAASPTSPTISATVRRPCSTRCRRTSRWRR